MEIFFNITNEALIFSDYYNKCTIHIKITFRRFENFINIKSKKIILKILSMKHYLYLINLLVRNILKSIFLQKFFNITNESLIF